MGGLNRLSTAAVDLALRPLERLHPMLALVVVSLLSAAGMLLVVRALADAAKVDAAKRRMQAGVFEMRLFNDDLRALARAQLDVLRATGAYLRASLVPVVVLAVPFTLLTAQLDAFFGYQGFDANQPVLVTARLPADVAGQTARSASIVGDDRVRIETPAVWIPGTRELMWRIRPMSEGEHVLHLMVAGVPIDKTLRVSDRLGRRSPLRPSGAGFAQVRYPSEAALPADSPVTSVALDYPAREMSVLGWKAPWLVFYLGWTILLALALRRPLRAPL